MSRKIQTYLYYSLFLFTPLLMSSKTSELFEFNKMIFIYVVTLLVGAVWIIRMIQTKKSLVVRTPLDIPIALFLGLQILSTFFSIDFHTSIFGYYGRYNGGLLSIGAYLLLYYSFVSYLKEDSDWFKTIRQFLKLSLYTSVLVILWAVPGRLGHDLSCLLFMGKFDNSCWTAQFDPAARMFSTLGQPNWFGAYLAIHFCIALFFYFYDLPSDGKKLLVHRLIWALYLAFVFMIVIFTHSRSSLLGLFVGSFLFFVFQLILEKGKWIDYLKQWGILLLPLFIVAVIFKTGIGQIDRFITLSTYFPKEVKKEVVPAKPKETAVLSSEITESMDIRKIVWKGAKELGMQYPLFGTGVETFAYSYYFVRPQEHNLTSEWDYLYNKAHNEYLNYFATTGFLGIGTYLILILAYLGLSAKKIVTATGNEEKMLILALDAAYVTVLITNFFGFSTTTMQLFFFLIPAVVISSGNEKNELPIEKPINSSEWFGVATVGLIVLFGLSFLFNYWMADVKFATADAYTKMNNYEAAAPLLRTALDMHYEHVYEDKLSYAYANLAFSAAYEKNKELTVDFMKLAKQFNDSSLKASPENILYYKTQIKNDYVFYQITLQKQYLEHGIESLRKAQELSPTDAKLRYFSAMYYSLLYDEEKDSAKKEMYKDLAFSSLETSLKLKKDYYDSYFLKLQLLKKYKQMSEAKALGEYILKYIAPGSQDVQNEMKTM